MRYSLRTAIFGPAILLLASCASIEHHRIATEQAAQNQRQGIPTHGEDNRNQPIAHALHGLLWWKGSEAVKEAAIKASQK